MRPSREPLFAWRLLALQWAAGEEKGRRGDRFWSANVTHLVRAWRNSCGAPQFVHGVYGSCIHSCECSAQSAKPSPIKSLRAPIRSGCGFRPKPASGGGGVFYVAWFFCYHRPKSVLEAVALLADLGEDARPLAGGHSLIPMMKLQARRARASRRLSPASPTSRASAPMAATSSSAP